MFLNIFVFVQEDEENTIEILGKLRITQENER